MPTSIAFDDIDGDGVNDLAVSSLAYSLVAWLRNTGNGTFDPTQHVVSSSAKHGNGVAIADVYV